MGIYKDNRSVIDIWYHNLPIYFVYVGERQVWPNTSPLIQSCYALGYWIDENPWTEDTAWVD